MAGAAGDQQALNVVEPPEEYDYESLPPNFSLAANMAAGAFAGIAEHSVMYPVDLLKVSRAFDGKKLVMMGERSGNG